MATPTYRHPGFVLWGTDIDANNNSITNIQNLTTHSGKELQNPEIGASYIVFTDGTTTYVKNGSTGKIDYSGTDTSTVINNAISGCPDGGKILVSGKYTISASLTLDSNMTFAGFGESTILKMADGVNINMITSVNKTSVTIKDMKLDGNKAANTGGSCIALSQAEKHVIQNLHIINAPLHGVAITGVNGYASGNIVTDCIIENSGHRNILFDPRVKNSIISNNICTGGGNSNILVGHGSFDVQILDNFCSVTTNADGIVVHNDVHNVIVTGNKVLNSKESGILLNQHVYDCVISNNICNNNENGIRLNANLTDGVYDFVTDGDTERNLISNNICNDNDVDGILLSYDDTGNVVKRNIIMNNVCVLNGQIGINESNGQSKNTICGNHVVANSDSQISVSSSDSSAFCNYGVSPFDWGAKSSVPTPFGEGDSYYNTTDHKKYVYDGTSWQALW